jgi:hypothetical protein
MHCNFKTTYYNEDGKEMTFKCNEEYDILGSGKCIFHDPTDPPEKDLIIRKMVKLDRKLSEASREPLMCVGYRLSKLIKDNILNRQVNFSKAVFMGSVDLSEVQFMDRVSFSEALFVLVFLRHLAKRL